VSATISYSVDEVPAIVDWLLENWDNYIGVSFLFRADPTKTAEDLGYLYLPQSVVTKDVYDAYVANLQPIDLNQGTDMLDAVIEDECAGGACPIR
jgi:ribonucleoside-triphosphate reductase